MSKDFVQKSYGLHHRRSRRRSVCERKADWNVSHPGWKAAAKAGKSVGLEWGGDWTGFKDIPHYQYTSGLSLADCQKSYAAGGLPAVWAEVS